jgi:hypothetical protein
MVDWTSKIVNSEVWQKYPTWYWESLIVALILASVTASTTSSENMLVNILAMFAVYYTFLHVKVASRLEEAQEKLEVNTVECYERLTHYLIIKEFLWVGVFFLTGAYSAIVGNIVFLLYPAWRKIYLKARKKIKWSK